MRITRIISIFPLTNLSFFGYSVIMLRGIASKLGMLEKKRVWFIAAIILVIGSIAYNTLVPKPIPQDKTFVVKRTTFSNTLSFPGEINADERVTVGFQAAGKLVWVGVKEGDIVEKGQGLASLDQRQLKKELEKKLDLFMKTRYDLDQARENKEDNTKPPLDDQLIRLAEKAQLDVNNSVRDVELQTLVMDNSYLTTPIAGIVTRIDAPFAGVNIAPTQQIEIINPATVYFAALIDQTDVATLRESMTGEVTLDAFPDTPLRGTVQSISFTPQTDETGTVYEARVSLLNPDLGTYRMGMTGDVTFTLGERPDVLVIPVRYIREDGDTEYVFRKKERGGYERVDVETGEEFDGDIEIVNGLSQGDVIYDVDS
jgi:RND family efflux transporter MFP subunit